MSIFNWMIDKLASEDVIDLYFFQSDLVEINLTEAEIFVNAYFDSVTSAAVHDYKGASKIPIGKQVL